MKNYRIADLSVNMSVGGTNEKQSEKYKVSDSADKNADIVIPDLGSAVQYLMTVYEGMSEDSAAYQAAGVAFYKALIDFNGFMLHASAVVLEDRAYLFSADSGVGKSTHTALWLQRFPSAYILNDDKPAIRLVDGKPYAYGTPWSGKTDTSVNVGVPLGAICFLQRAEENDIRPLSAASAIHKLMRQTAPHRQMGKEKIDKLLDIWETVLLACPVYEMGCLPQAQAAELAYRTMKGIHYAD